MMWFPREAIAAALSHALIGDPSYAEVFRVELTRYVLNAPPRDAAGVLKAMERACVEARKALGEHTGMDPRVVSYELNRVDGGYPVTNEASMAELLVDVLRPRTLVELLLGVSVDGLGTGEVRLRLKGPAATLRYIIHAVVTREHQR